MKMKIYLSENLRRLRAERGIKQEELAKHIGISVQSVSKWERGETLPDITLLPKIAEFYSVSADELLGTGKSRREREIGEFKTDWDSLALQRYYAARLALAEKMYADYPNEPEVLRRLMVSLRENGYFERSLEITEKLLMLETDPETHYEAVRNGAFCSHWFERYGRQCADMLTGYFGAGNQLYTGLFQGAERADKARENIEALTLCLCSNIRALNRGLGERDKIELWEKGVELIELVCGADSGVLTDSLLRFYIFLAHDSALLGDREAALSYLQKSAELARKSDAKPDGEYSSVLLSGRKYTHSGRARMELRAQMERWAGFEELRNDNAFVSILNSLPENG